MELIRVGGAIVVSRGGDPRDRDALLKLRVQVAHDLVRVCRGLASDHQLRTYSLFVARVSRLRVFVGQNTGLFFSRLAQQADPDEFAQYITAGAQRKVMTTVLHELHHAQRLLLKLIDRGWLGLVCYAWSSLTETLQELMTRLKHDGLADGANELRAWLDSVGTVCRDVAAQIGDAKLLELCAITHMRIELDNGDEAFEKRRAAALQVIAKIADPAVRKAAERQVEKLAEFVRENPDETDTEYDEATLEQVVRKMALGLGIDLDDPNDEIAAIARIGIRDDNPDRVVRECTHLLVQLGSRGIPAQMLGLSAAGSKYVSCKKHGYRSGGLMLDNIYAHFKSSHCNDCPDREPHAADWKWTRAYQKDEETTAERNGFGPPRW